ncbi:bolA-like protein 3 isoform X6 [Schistocerca gregaria]|uniref:bolA-like protein 3 isoform X1 n=1 Tax=Schistocerca gregaria TaxID=7010 RepID=UPI00211E7859|nr:bolA-like protein 3 isoform X1 [Schistocerca gregaria]XP_049860468.1 bolA-like protein 3 isoform X2 [Schistocerca gregaria]XP_049860469.1 bolA-like protein 3 isoform X3 [Schistocerca gregaria]XP_049860470.1 bolA-like protein 3 isoform X4 [Schistocerca gregaria]XP_049860472.1 bolA-like protein 3 isoform X5 [Schistocerca gregaria]XP_049860473.1 bolA-like protein 3 isoform X6 [Schistocerca gregaria]
MFRNVCLAVRGTRSLALFSRVQNGNNTGKSTDLENRLKEILRQQFPKAKSIDVVDISGGCGAMFEISVEAPEFKGLNTVKQHRLVNNALKEQIKEMHGLRIHTSVPS